MNVNGMGVPLGVPTIGVGDQVAAAIHRELFCGLFVQLAMFRTVHGYQNEAGLSDSATPQQIANEADALVTAALAKLGIKRLT